MCLWVGGLLTRQSYTDYWALRYDCSAVQFVRPAAVFTVSQLHYQTCAPAAPGQAGQA